MSKANDGLSTPETVPSIADRLWADTEIPPELQSPEFAAYTRAHEAFYSWNSPEDIPDSLRDADGAGVVAVLKRLARSEFDVFEKAIALRDLIIAPGDGEAHSIANSEDVISLIMAIIDLYRADLPLLNLGAELRSRWAAEAAWLASTDPANDINDDEHMKRYMPISELVEKIARAPTPRSLQGLRVKGMALAWCRGGEYPVEFDGVEDEATTDARVVRSILNDVVPNVAEEAPECRMPR